MMMTAVKDIRDCWLDTKLGLYITNTWSAYICQNLQKPDCKYSKKSHTTNREPKKHQVKNWTVYREENDPDDKTLSLAPSSHVYYYSLEFTPFLFYLHFIHSYATYAILCITLWGYEV